jgi:hypothetical protein
MPPENKRNNCPARKEKEKLILKNYSSHPGAGRYIEPSGARAARPGRPGP